MTRKDLFRRLLGAYWLRPENALKTTIRADAFRSTVDLMEDGSRTVDVSCGDGIYSFLLLGGRLTHSSDMFRAVKTEQVVRDANYDAFDHYEEGKYQVEVEEPAPISYQYGTDWKPNLLRRAARLHFYHELIQHDNNQPLPFEDNSMRYVSNNSPYWVERFAFHLEDMARVVEPGGHVVLEMKTREIERFTSREYASFMGERFHQIVNGARAETWKGLPWRSELEEILENLESVTVERFEPVFGGLPEKLWDIGLRPLFTPLAKLVGAVDDATRDEVKEEWCEIMYDLLAEFVESYRVDPQEAVEYLIVLRKN